MRSPLFYHLRTLFRTIRYPHVALVIAALISTGVSSGLVMEFNQLWYIALGLMLPLYGPASALILSVMGLCGLMIKVLQQNRLHAIAVCIAAIVAAALLGQKDSLIVIVMQAIFLGSFVILGTILTHQLHLTLSPEIRNGAASLVSTLTRLFFIPTAIVFGIIAHHYTIFSTMYIVVLLTIITTLLCMSVLRNKNYQLYKVVSE